MAMTEDQLADDFKRCMDELHAHIEMLPSGPLKTRFRRRAKVAHAILDEMRQEALEADLIQPMSGGEPKPQ